MLETIITHWALTFAITLFSTLLALIFAWQYIERRVFQRQSYDTKVHMVTLAIKDLNLNMWFTYELLHNADIRQAGTYARYWFDGIKGFNIAALTGSAHDYLKIMPLIHMLDVDNRKLEDGDYEGVVTNALAVQEQLRSWIPIINTVIQENRLKIPLLPSADHMLLQIQQQYS